MFYALYSLLLFLALLLYAPFYWAKVRFVKKDRLRLGERLGIGLPRRPSGRPCLWIHAVSVGEVLSLQSLIREVKAKHPDWEIAFSSLTGTGLRQAREKIKDADPVFFIPLDFRGPVRRVLSRLNPDLLILAESELWPNLLREARRRTKGVLVINGRMSERAFRNYLMFKGPARRVLGQVDRFLVQTKRDGDRIAAVGVDPGRIEVVGNLKAEVRLPPPDREEEAVLKKSLGLAEDRTVVLAGSTRKGEEDRLLAAFARSRGGVPPPVLIIAPRHPERAGDIERIAAGLGLTCARRTTVRPGEVWDVLILDTIGELARFYAFCDAAFVGGSLVAWGGHNFLEPAYYGKPVFFGPHMTNFATLARSFLEEGAARVVSTDEDLVRMLRLEGVEDLREMGRKAAAVLDSMAGATARTVKAIEDMMGRNKR
ncbi:MAG: 3-deoxy-D-manno-octulosonic acid transferase [Candidatus Aminicenantes bacterium]|nr:3-deoxy-D-manno-octulosonic acid transferase [Candidatus Aminicenantes bacterium]